MSFKSNSGRSDNKGLQVCYDKYSENILIRSNNAKQWDNVNKYVGNKIWSAFEALRMSNLKEKSYFVKMGEEVKAVVECVRLGRGISLH